MSGGPDPSRSPAPAIRSVQVVTQIPPMLSAVLLIAVIELALGALSLQAWWSARAQVDASVVPPVSALVFTGLGVLLAVLWVRNLRTRQRMKRLVATVERGETGRPATVTPVWVTGRRYPPLGFDVTDASGEVGWVRVPRVRRDIDPTARFVAFGSARSTDGVALYAPDTGQLIVGSRRPVPLTGRRAHPASPVAARVLGWTSTGSMPASSAEPVFELPAEGRLDVASLAPTAADPDRVVELAVESFGRFRRSFVMVTVALAIAFGVAVAVVPTGGLVALVLLVAAAAEGGPALLRRASGPLRAHLVARCGVASDEARDVAAMVMATGLAYPDPPGRR